jgi:hypothetical protein
MDGILTVVTEASSVASEARAIAERRHSRTFLGCPPFIRPTTIDRIDKLWIALRTVMRADAAR